MPPGYPKLVTFTDMNDPKSVTLVQVWERKKDGHFFLKEDRMEELFGAGVSLKGITLEITDEPVQWGVVDGYLPPLFYAEVKDRWLELSIKDRRRMGGLTTFKQGELK